MKAEWLGGVANLLLWGKNPEREMKAPLLYLHAASTYCSYQAQNVKELARLVGLHWEIWGISDTLVTISQLVSHDVNRLQESVTEPLSIGQRRNYESRKTDSWPELCQHWQRSLFPQRQKSLPHVVATSTDWSFIVELIVVNRAPNDRFKYFWG